MTELKNEVMFLLGFTVLVLDSHPDLNKEPDPRTLDLNRRDNQHFDCTTFMSCI